MKKIIIISLILSSILLNSQTYEPGQIGMTLNKINDVLLSPDMPEFQMDEFLLGWHWGATKKITKALLSNQNDAGQWSNIADIADSCYAFFRPIGYSHATGGEILNGRGFLYEPTLALDPNQPDELVIRSGDTTHPVFGFTYRRGRVLTDSTDANFNRLIIDGDSLIDSVILKDVWPSNQLSMVGEDRTKLTVKTEEEIPPIWENYLCKHLFFSINLRRFDTGIGSDPILKIELPYFQNNHNNVENL